MAAMASFMRHFLLASLVCAAMAAPRKKGRGGNEKNVDISKAFDLSPDPNDPHSKGFVPRPHPDESGDIWAFGKAHAIIQHVLKNTSAGNAVQVVDAFEAFSSEHQLIFGLGPALSFVIDRMVRTVITKLEALAASDQTTKALRILVLGAGLNGRTLRCLPVLLDMPHSSNKPHEIASVEHDAYFSSGGSQLVEHAIDGTDTVRHTPLMPGDDTSLKEVLESLDEGYDLRDFDIVFLEGNVRATQVKQLATLVHSRALHCGSVVHAVGPGRDDQSTEQYIKFLHERSFEHEVQDIGSDTISIMSTLGGDCGVNNEL